MLAVALEDRVLAHVDHHVQVARRTTQGAGLALAGEADAVAGIDAGEAVQALLVGTELPHADAADTEGLRQQWQDLVDVLLQHLGFALSCRHQLLQRASLLLQSQ